MEAKYHSNNSIDLEMFIELLVDKFTSWDTTLTKLNSNPYRTVTPICSNWFGYICGFWGFNNALCD